METSNESTSPTLFDPTSFAADTPANLLAPLANDKAKKTCATSGHGYDKPYAFYDPVTQSLKMYEATCPLAELPCLAKLPPSGTLRNGVLFLRPLWEPITAATDSLSWPTPTAVVRPMEGNVRLYRAKIEAGEMTEEEATAILGKSPYEAQGKIPAMWPTPTYGKLAGGTGGMKQIEAKYLAGEISAEERKAMRAGNGGKLNPMWVEWLMGFPPGWTDLEDLETPSFPKSPK